MSTPRFFMIIFRFWEISLSMLARMRSSASTTVTRQPRALNTEANSMPITPPPMMTRLWGSLSQSSSSSLVTTPGKSAPGIGGTAGVEPVAMRMCSVSSSVPSGSTRTRPESTMEAEPWITVTLFAFIREAMPPRSCSTTAFLRA